MSGVRVLIGTRKGAFILTSDGKRETWDVRGPMLCGTIRDQRSGKRRAFVRFFACQQDLSHEPPDQPLPDAVAAGTEPYLIVGAMAGG